jgi:hypothetical protein
MLFGFAWHWRFAQIGGVRGNPLRLLNFPPRLIGPAAALSQREAAVPIGPLISCRPRCYAPTTAVASGLLLFAFCAAATGPRFFAQLRAGSSKTPKTHTPGSPPNAAPSSQLLHPSPKKGRPFRARQAMPGRPLAVLGKGNGAQSLACLFLSPPPARCDSLA